VVVDEKGRVWSFGENKYGQLGRVTEGKTDPKPSLVVGMEPALRGSTISVDCGWSHTLLAAKSADGTSVFYGWGRNDKGQLGTGTQEPVPSPKELFADKNLATVACSSESTVVVDIDGRIWGCGWNEHGNLGARSQEDKYELTLMLGARVVGPPGVHDGTITIAAGGAHFFAAKVI
jgi:alpha-tubulin suppressor-like RCC1 family protein